MSSNKIGTIGEGAIVIANDLKTGTSVYLTSGGSWSHNVEDALIMTSNEMAEAHLLIAKQEQQTALILDPYLIETDAHGLPLHIRERIRTLGPSCEYRVP